MGMQAAQRSSGVLRVWYKINHRLNRSSQTLCRGDRKLAYSNQGSAKHFGASLSNSRGSYLLPWLSMRKTAWTRARLKMAAPQTIIAATRVPQWGWYTFQLWRISTWIIHSTSNSWESWVWCKRISTSSVWTKCIRSSPATSPSSYGQRTFSIFSWSYKWISSPMKKSRSLM